MPDARGDRYSRSLDRRAQTLRARLPRRRVIGVMSTRVRACCVRNPDLPPSDRGAIPTMRQATSALVGTVPSTVHHTELDDVASHHARPASAGATPDARRPTTDKFKRRRAHRAFIHTPGRATALAARRLQREGAGATQHEAPWPHAVIRPRLRSVAWFQVATCSSSIAEPRHQSACAPGGARQTLRCAPSPAPMRAKHDMTLACPCTP